MHEKTVYEYAIIRILPCVEREEFVNVGVVVFAKKARFLKVKYFLNTDRLNAFTHAHDLELLEKNLISFQAIAEGNCSKSPIAQFDIAERFRWLTAVRSSCIQTSRPHPGISDDLDKTLAKIFEEQVI